MTPERARPFSARRNWQRIDWQLSRARHRSCYRRNAGRYAFQMKAVNGPERSELIMRRHGLAAVGALVLLALVESGAPHAEHVRAPERIARTKTVNCAEPPYRNAVRGTLKANLEISVYPGVCVVTGRVKGSVTVRNADGRCTTGSRYVALSLKGGSIDGQVEAAGKKCVMVWLFDGAIVKGKIVYEAAGNLGFLGDRTGARIRGNVLLEKGLLWATGTSTTNRIDGNLACDGGRPAGIARLATRTNWDGAGRDENDETVDVDGSTGGRYIGCHKGP
jgi:hypothetical protein